MPFPPALLEMEDTLSLPVNGLAPGKGPTVTFAEPPTPPEYLKRSPPSPDIMPAPGISFDARSRVFSLRCKSSMYAFRVDDAKNLEHLYWGPALPSSDDIQYLTNVHVPTPFDPADHVSVQTIDKVLGIAELRQIKTVHDIQETWKVATKQKDGGQIQGRRLENVSWRLWNMERHRGGDLNFDLPTKMAENSIKLEDDDFFKRATRHGANAVPKLAQMTTPKSPAMRPPAFPGTPPQSQESIAGSPSAIPSSLPQPAAPAALPGMFPMPRSESRGMLQSRSVGFLAGLDNRAAPTADEIGVAAKREYQRTGSNLQHALASTASIPSNPSAGDLTMSYKDIVWDKLDPQQVGKSSKLMEFSDVGTGDYREPSFRVRFQDTGSTISPLTYSKHSISKRKPPMKGYMPYVYTDRDDETTTLIVDMVDDIAMVKVQLHYTVCHNYDIITRRTVVTNEGPTPVTIESVASGTVDFDAEYAFYMTQLSGGWARERQVVTQKLEDGVTVLKSCRGTSSHQFNPFAVVSPKREPSEDEGECFGFSFVYSGNFAITAEVNEYRRLRVNVGINPEMFSWQLDKKESKHCSFETPELIMAYSDTGMGKMSRDLHRLMRERVIPKRWRYKVPPVLLNTWEAVYFNLDHEIILSIATAAARGDIEMIVLDDGWFGKRDNVSSGLGDWKPNRTKLLHGVDGLATAINRLGLRFGIWVEPEMVSIDSDLFRKNPDWCLCVPNRGRTIGRQQLVLDFSRQAVVDHIYGQLVELLSSANIEYVKWDMNRHLTEIFSQGVDPSRQGEVSHRYMLGVYECMDKITRTFPNVRFEMCSGGGGRFDPGMLFFSPQIWTSDNTDALSRTKIQYGSSLVYPMCSMGAHVSAIPNHQTRRGSTMKIRSLVAMSGTFGYELDPRLWTEEDVSEIKGFVRMQKRVANLVYEGDFFRIWSPFQAESCAWMFVSPDKTRGIVMAFNIRREVGRLEPRLKLNGLRADLTYCVEELCPGTITFDKDTGAAKENPRGVYQFGKPIFLSGQTCMKAGLPVKFLFDGDSVVYEVNAVDATGAKLTPRITGTDAE